MVLFVSPTIEGEYLVSKTGNDRAAQAREAYAEHLKVTAAANYADLEAKQNTEQALRLRWDLEVHLADWADRMGITVCDLETTFSSTMNIGDSTVLPPTPSVVSGVSAASPGWDMSASYENGYEICVKLERAHERMIIDEPSFGEFLDHLRSRWPDMLLSRKKRDKLARKRRHN